MKFCAVIVCLIAKSDAILLFSFTLRNYIYLVSFLNVVPFAVMVIYLFNISWSLHLRRGWTSWHLIIICNLILLDMQTFPLCAGIIFIRSAVNYVKQIVVRCFTVSIIIWTVWDQELGSCNMVLSGIHCRLDNWVKASPWLNQSVNPRDLIMPTDGDDGFFPTSANQFVSLYVPL